MTYTLQFTQQEIQTISMGLGELPLKIAVNLFGKIQKTVSEQDAASAIPLDSIRAEFDAAVDARDMPSGAVKQPDQFAGN